VSESIVEAEEARAVPSRPVEEERSTSERNWRRRPVWLVVFGDAVAAAVGVAAVEWTGLQDVEPSLMVAGAIAWVLVLQLNRVYDRSVDGLFPTEFERLAVAGLWSLIGLVVFERWLRPAGSLTAIAIALVLSTAFHEGFRDWLRWRARRGRLHRRTVVTGSAAVAADLAARLEAERDVGFQIVALAVPLGEEIDAPWPVLGHPTASALVAAEEEASLLVVAEGAVDRTGLLGLLRSSADAGVAVLVEPGAVEVAGLSPALIRLSSGSLLQIEEPRIFGASWVLKAWIDRIGSTILLVLTSPILLVAALSVRLTSRGPAFFRQQRAGRRGRPFTIYKLRTMTAGAEQALAEAQELAGESGPFFKYDKDPRVTRVGRWLRRYSLDELPQLWNVVKGDMSLVGPRPLPLHEAKMLTLESRRRTLARPGLTGLWQVSGRSALDAERAVELDLAYLDNWSLASDLNILLRTILVVVRGDGT
jgi:exopolysaccharide biosynthesis polyprenyl glycosylphosphotransferase